jgi:hypothetical protein
MFFHATLPLCHYFLTLILAYFLKLFIALPPVYTGIFANATIYSNQLLLLSCNFVKNLRHCYQLFNSSQY